MANFFFLGVWAKVTFMCNWNMAEFRTGIRFRNSRDWNMCRGGIYYFVIVLLFRDPAHGIVSLWVAHGCKTVRTVWQH